MKLFQKRQRRQRQKFFHIGQRRKLFHGRQRGQERERIPVRQRAFEQIKAFFRVKKHVFQTVFLAVCLFCAAFFLCVFGKLKENDTDQTAAARWQAGEQAFAQISLYISPEEKFQEHDRNSLLSRLRMVFQENSITNENTEAGDEGLCHDCYSCEGKLTLTRGKNSVEAAVTATGGDFFYFHPKQWLSGYAYSSDDVMQDRVVLDKETAWNLFGSADVAGMSLSIGDHTYYVAGVVDISTDSADKAAYGEAHRAWMPYSAYCKEMGVEQQEGTVTEKPPITAYEIVMPNPVVNWAKNQISDAVSAEGRDIVMIENSKRADMLTVLESIKNFTHRGMIVKPVAYPHWENAAQVRDAWRELCLVVVIIFLIYPLLLGLAVIRWLYHMLGRGMAKLKERFSY